MATFSPQTITALVHAATGSRDGSGQVAVKYRTGPQIQMLLGNCDIDLSIGMQGRIPAVRAVLTQINRSDDAFERLSPLFEAVVNPAEYRGNDADLLPPLVAYLNDGLRSDGYELVEASGRYRLLAVGSQSPAARAVRGSVDRLDWESVRHHLDNALALTEERPDGAIRAACSTLESLIATMLDRMGVELPSDRSIGPLYRELARSLDLTPSRPDLENDVRQILGGLTNTVAGIGALRTHASDAHGQAAGTIRPDSRMARLAVHAASAACEFLIATWLVRGVGMSS